ncbi:MAG: hypothetical protein PVG24_04170 [Gammaproteobacteria bacterium]|jgi:hypothetical protein
MSWLLLLAATAGAFTAFRLTQRKPAVAASARGSAGSENDFACVELQCARSSCRAARRLRKVSRLASDAPVLPLPGCDKGICGCRYVKTSDRRQSEGRRLLDLGIRPLIFEGQEQRESIDDRRV